MPLSEPMLDRLKAWGEGRDDLRAMILVGSRATGVGVDEYSDYDVSLFVTDQDGLAFDLSWLAELGEVLLCEKNTDEGELGVHPVHYRLVVFEGGARVDFSIHSLRMLEQIVRSEIPSEASLYSLGYRVLLDKDGRTAGMAPPLENPPPIAKPSEEEYHGVVEDFWHEAHNVAKYLARGDLWSAKFRDWQTKSYLLRMLEWSSRAREGWDFDTRTLGKRMNEWLDEETWGALHEAFGRFEAEDAWRALFATIEIFRKAAGLVADHLGFVCLEKLDQRMMPLIRGMRADSGSS